MYFLSIPLIAAVNPSGKPTFVNIEIAGLISFGRILPRIGPKGLFDFIILFICALLNFISADMLFSIFSFSLFICSYVKMNS